MTFLENTSGLEWLDLTDCKITGTGLQHIHSNQDFVGLSLRLENTSLTDDDLAGLKNVNRLGAVSLVGTNVTGVGFQRLPSTLEIGSLDMSNTKLNEAGLRELANREHLRALIVDPTLVTTAKTIFAESHKSTRISDVSPQGEDFW